MPPPCTLNGCVAIAPESVYTEGIYARGFLVAPAQDAVEGMIASDSLTVQPVGYQIQTSDGADDLERRFDQVESDAILPPKRLRLFCELGALYNSNVLLTPISRELFNIDAESFQAIFNPEIEWIAMHDKKWRSGPLLRSYSTLNESNQQAFNLFSIQPGWFHGCTKPR
jgi:hypothetical protein